MSEPRQRVSDHFLLTPLAQAQLECEQSLHRLEKLFKPGCRLTLIMRTPGMPEAEILWTKDNLVAVIQVIQRFRLRDAIAASGERCPGGDGCQCCRSGCDCGCRDSCPRFVGMISEQLRKGGVA